MKRIKLFLETMRLKKSLGKSYTLTNKRDLSITELEKQIEIGEIINENIFSIFTKKFITFFLLFYLFILCTILYILPENVIILVIYSLFLISIIILPITYVFNLISYFDSSSRQLSVNKLLTLSKTDEFKDNILVIESKTIIEKFNEFYKINEDTDLMIIDNSTNDVIIYSCSINGYVLKNYINEETQLLINSKKITLNEFVETIKAS